MRLLLIAVVIQASLAAPPPSVRKIAAVRVFGNPGQTGLFIASSDGSGEHPLLSSQANNYDPAWAPDGSSIVFTSERDGSADLYRAKPDGSELERLTNDPAYEDQAAFSPDGKQIACSSVRGSAFPFSHGRWERLELAEIYVIHPDGSGMKKITHTGGFCGSPKWTSDGGHVLAYCMSAEQTLANRWYPTAAGNDTKLVSIDTGTGT